MTTFASLALHPAVARALAARGYDNATPVQTAVLEPRCEGRDLMVSSQTGSGKTIAFGALLAQTLLDPASDGQPRPRPTRPLALTVVPTRELAAQVREELGWVLRETGLRLACFTGGTSVGGDLRVLAHGVDVAIGTPGRLCDLIRRERLDLTAVRVVVLDEADEMLDLGFREDLEMLLQAAPVERRTILMSATLPLEIRSLARKFQRDAVAVDPRAAAGASATPGTPVHEDISFVAHLVAPGDKLAAVVNVLRAFDLQSAEAARAIVFGTTREGVARLHEELVARGFAATVISGDRAQAERDRALQQVRRGDARVLVATNVAARGIHLPEVDLIVHADLPLNAESLTHRSGRTGRAGRKGTAVLIVAAHERRKAERLLGAIRVQASWKPAPEAAVIATAARDRLVTELLAEPEDVAATAEDSDVEALIQKLEAQRAPRALLAQFLARELGRLPLGEPLTSLQPPAAGARDGVSGPRRSPGDFARGGVTFRVNLGARDKADPRWMLPLICRRGGVTRREVGAIRVGPRETTFEIAGDAARDFADAAAVSDPRAPQVRIERLDGGGHSERPTREARPAPPSRGSSPARAAKFAPTAAPVPAAVPAPAAAPPPAPASPPVAAAVVSPALESPPSPPLPPSSRPAPAKKRPARAEAPISFRPARPLSSTARSPVAASSPAGPPDARPGAPGPRPMLSTARPAPHSGRPAPRGPRPTAHGPRAAGHGPRPGAHGSRPAAHGDRPAPHGPRPGPHGPRPAPRHKPKSHHRN